MSIKILSHTATQGLFLFVLAILPFLPGLNGDYIQDDIPIIRDNTEIREVSNLPGLFTELYWRDKAKADLYRPLTMASYLFDGALWGREADGAPKRTALHASSFILHALTVLCLYMLFVNLFDSRIAAFLGAAVFAVHPIHTEAVVHLVGRADVLMAFFFIASMLVYCRTEEKRKSWLILSATLYFCSMLSKEMGVMLLPLLFINDFFSREKSSFTEFLHLELKRLWLHGAALAVFMLLRGLVIGAAQLPPQLFAFSAESQFTAFIDPRPGEVFFTMLHAFGCYVLLSFVPLWHSADYSGFPHSTELNLWSALSLLSILILFILAGWKYRNGVKQYLFCFLCFFLTLIPVSNLLVTSGIVFAERALYLPSAAVCAVFGIWGQLLWKKWRTLTVVLFLVILALFAYQSYRQSMAWKNGLAIFEYSEKQSPFFGFIGKASLAEEYSKRLDEEPELFSRALDLARASVAQATSGFNVSQLAGLLERDGQYEESLKWWSGLFLAVPDREYYYLRTNEVLKKYFVKMESLRDFPHAARAVELGAEYARKRNNETELSFWLDKREQVFEAWLAEEIFRGREEEARKICKRFERENPCCAALKLD